MLALLLLKRPLNLLFYGIFLYQSFLIGIIQTADYQCPADCSESPCPIDENPHCIEFESYNPSQCKTCEDGYFYKSIGSPCVSCDEVYYGTCASCENVDGCNICNCGNREYDASCGIRFCDASDACSTLSGSNTDTSDTTTNSDTTDTSDTSSATTSDDTGDTVDVASLITTDAAIAEFFNNDINGYVTIYQGYVNISLDFSEFSFDDRFEDVDGTNCFKGGIKYGIYNKWEHSDKVDKLFDDCDSSYTGDRWDPWLACSSASSNKYCEIHGSSKSCIPYGGVSKIQSDSQYSDDVYICDEYNYVSNPLSCEVGDLSGKYGQLTYNSKTKKISTIIGSPFETDGKDLGGMSVVFRCNDNTRAFCAPFKSYEDVNSETSKLQRPYQNETRSDIVSKKAYFGSDSYIYLSFFGKYEIVLTKSDFASIPGDCGTDIYYRIFDDSDCGGSQSENTHFYDPTVTCQQQSSQFTYGYCEYVDDSNVDISEGYRCDDTSYEFKSATYCSNYFATFGYYRWYCSPSDLSGKFGSIDISTSINFDISEEGYDDLMIPLNLLQGKSVGLQCSDTYEIVACASWDDYTDDAGESRDTSTNSGNTNDDDNDSSNSSGSSGDGTILGVNSGLFWFIFIMALLTIIPCVRWMKNKQQQGNEIANKYNNRGGSPYSPRNGGVNGARSPHSGTRSPHSHGSGRTTPVVGAGGGNNMENAMNKFGNFVRTATNSITAPENMKSGSATVGGIHMTYNDARYNKNLTIQQKAALKRKHQTQPTLAGGGGA